MLNTKKILRTVTFFLAAVALSACAGKQPVNLKIHTEPEGSHIVYRVVKADMQQDAPWIYLGVSPYQGLTQMDPDSLSTNDTVTFKVMRHGYMDQVKEWTGEQFLAEYERENRLFWAPRLVKVSK